MERTKTKHNQISCRKAKGITLIALIITIVILIILATVAVSFVFGEEGLISRAQQAAEMTERQELIEQIELTKAEVAAENGGKVTAEDFFEKLEENGIIGSVEGDVTDNGDGTFTVITNDGHEIEVTVTEDGKIETEYVGKSDEPGIRKIEVSKTSNSVTITVETRNAEEGKLSYSYKKNSEGEDAWQDVEANTDSNTCTINNLQQDEIYNIKVVLEINGETIERIVNVQVGEMPAGTVAISFTNATWQDDGTASITINNKEEGYTLQYQIVRAEGGELTEEGWSEIASGTEITGLKYGDTVYGRLWDGTNGSSPANATIEDNIAPEIASIEIKTNSATPYEKITATVTLADNQSGVDIAGSKWTYNTNSGNIGTEETSYTNSFTGTENPDQIELQATSAGTYYLHVLTKDKAGNTIETISNGVEVKEVTGTPIADIIGQTQQDTTKVKAPMEAENPNWQGNLYLPGGFQIKSDSTNYINEGIVITDGTNEFVWIPVSSAQLEDMYEETPTQLSTVTDMTPVTTDRYSKLRDRTTGEIMDTNTNKPGTTRYREPDILTSTSNGDAKPENIATIKSVFASELAKYGVDTSSNPLDAQVLNAWAQMLVDEYNETYESIVTYGGFYIGRYEISGSVESPTVKQGGTVLVLQNWYNLKKACNNVVNNENVVSEMIYGNQWDRVLNWLVETEAKTQDEVYKDSSGWGNYRNYNEANPEHQITDAGTKVLPAGSSDYWCANNIYDLAGNAREWTQEASRTDGRVLRGGLYYNTGSDLPASDRGYYLPGLTFSVNSARAALYVK